MRTSPRGIRRNDALAFPSPQSCNPPPGNRCGCSLPHPALPVQTAHDLATPCDEPHCQPVTGRSGSHHSHRGASVVVYKSRNVSLCVEEQKPDAQCRGVAPFIAVCSLSILAETLCHSASFARQSRAKRRTSARHMPRHVDSLQPSPHADTLSEGSYATDASHISPRQVSERCA